MKKLIELWQFYFDKLRWIVQLKPVHRDYLGRSKVVSGKLRQSLVNKFTECSVCENCTEVCPTAAITIKSKKFASDEEVPISTSGHVFEKDLMSYFVDYTKCISCGDCVDSCPTKSLKFGTKELPSSQRTEDLVVDLIFQARKNKKLGGQLASKFE